MTRFVLCAVLMLAWGCSRPADPASSSPSPAAPAATTPQVVGRAAPGALVVLEPAQPVPLPEGPAIMDQYSKAFVPDLLFVRVGQPVIFKNSDDELHNVAVVRSRTGAGVFNISQNQGDTHAHTFEQGGEYNITCDVHPGMRATVVASNSPYAMYADTRGAFAFQRVPPGAYTLRVSRGGRVSERAVQVASAPVDLGDVSPGSGG